MVHYHTRCQIGPTFLIRGNNAEIQLERVGKGRDPFRATSVLRHDDAFPPIRHLLANPPRNQGLGVEVIDRALEESLHLRGVEVDGDDMLDAGHTHQVCQETRGDCASVGLLLGLAVVGKVRDDSWWAVAPRSEKLR